MECVQIRMVKKIKQRFISKPIEVYATTKCKLNERKNAFSKRHIPLANTRYIHICNEQPIHLKLKAQLILNTHTSSFKWRQGIFK